MITHRCVEGSLGHQRIRTHGPHDDQMEFFADLSEVLASRSPGKTLIVGDWNIDLLPTLSPDPFRDSPERMERHSERRLLLNAFLESSGLEAVIPERVRGLPGGTWNDVIFGIPITRVPTGSQAGLPSLLDSAAFERGLILDSEVCWEFGWSDHSINSWTVQVNFSRPGYRRRVWNVSSLVDCQSWCREKVPAAPLINGHANGCSSVFSPFFSCAESLRDKFQSRLPCKIQHSMRMPFALRDLYNRIAQCRTAEVSVLKRQAFLLHRTWIKNMATCSQRERIDRGHVLSRSKRMFCIKELRRSDSPPVVSQSEIVSSAAKVFGNKWGTRKLETRMAVLDFIHSTEAVMPDFVENDVERAFAKLKRKHVFDDEGNCLLLFELMFQAHPTEFTKWLRIMAGNSNFFKGLHAKCRVFGKTSCSPLECDLRAIVPMNSILRVFDRILGIKLQEFLDITLPPVRGCFAAGKKYTQALDIGHAANLVMEKSLDALSEGAFAQADVRQYFDSLPILSILQWMKRRGADVGLLGAVGRHQLLTVVRISIGASSVDVGGRSSGGLTGSFLALLLARVPMESSFKELEDALYPCGYPVEHTKLLVATYIDNVYAASRFTSSATWNIEVFFKHLKDHWGLDVKPKSKIVLPVRGAVDLATHGDGWSVQDSMMVLGWHIQSDGGLQAQWKELVPKLWGAFMRNLRQKGWQRLGVSRRFKLLDRAVRPIALRALSAWAPTPHYVEQVNKLQRRMAARALNVFRYPQEEWRNFRGRESRVAAREIEGTTGGWWARAWMRHSLSWDSHLERDWAEQLRFLQTPDPTPQVFETFITKLSWAAALVHHHDKKWFDERRVVTPCRDGLRVASRTGTRANPGHVQIRWHDRIAYCQRMVG